MLGGSSPGLCRGSWLGCKAEGDGSWRRKKQRAGRSLCHSHGARLQPLCAWGMALLGVMNGRALPRLLWCAPSPSKCVPTTPPPPPPGLPSCLLAGELSVPQAPSDGCLVLTPLLVAMEKPGWTKHDPLAPAHRCQEMKVCSRALGQSRNRQSRSHSLGTGSQLPQGGVGTCLLWLPSLISALLSLPSGLLSFLLCLEVPQSRCSSQGRREEAESLQRAEDRSRKGLLAGAVGGA